MGGLLYGLASRILLYSGYPDRGQAHVPFKGEDRLLEKRIKAEHRIQLIEKSYPVSNQQIYWWLIHFKTECLLFMLALTKKESVRKAISILYTPAKY